MSIQIDRSNDEPLKILGSDLKLWLDAEQLGGVGVTLPADGTNVSSWINLGTNYPNFEKINASRSPVFKINIQNGRPAVLFTRGTSTTAIDADHLQANAVPATIAYPYTIVTVSKLRNNNNNLNGVLSHGAGGGIVMASGRYSLDYNGQVLSNQFRTANALTDTFFTIGVRNNTSQIERIKIGDGTYVVGTIAAVKDLPNQVGGRFENYASNFQIWNPRNWDGWIFETMIIAGDITLNKGKENALISYLKLKYNL